MKFLFAPGLCSIGSPTRSAVCLGVDCPQELRQFENKFAFVSASLMLGDWKAYCGFQRVNVPKSKDFQSQDCPCVRVRRGSIAGYPESQHAKCKVGQVCGNRILSYLINIIDHRHINMGWLNTSTSFIQCPSRFVRPLVPHFWVAQLVRFKQSKCLFGLRSWIQKKLGRWAIDGKAWHWMTRDNMGGSENAPQNRLKWVILNGGTNCLGYSNFEKKTHLNTPYFVDFDIPVWSLCPH